jgi:glycine dehydrogenase subunit 1
MRFLPLTDTDRRDMMETIGITKVEELFSDVPHEALLQKPVNLPAGQSEIEVETQFRKWAENNLSPSMAPFFLGAGIYRHHIPAAVDYLIQRGEFLTSYTPYQPEVSQGTLQCLFEFQTQVALLTGMDVANASMYDGATSCAEAVMMAGRLTKRNKHILSGGLHPHYREVTTTMTTFLGAETVQSEPDINGQENLIPLIDSDTACVVVQNPSFFGHLHDFTDLAQSCHDHGALLVVAVTEAVSLGAITSPGEMGADIVAAEGQSLGNAMSFGGPTVGLLAGRTEHIRQLPGRLSGQTVDADNRRGFTLTLSTREQHIRREKATSNICTNAGLCALAFTIHLTMLGEEGFTRLAHLNHANAAALAEKLNGYKEIEVLNKTFFNEFTVRLPKPAGSVVNALAEQGILAGIPVSRLYPSHSDLDHLMLVAVTETNTESEVDQFLEALEGVLS